MRRWLIYALLEPESGEVRYVGKTHATMRERLAQHVSHSHRERTHRACWIRSLLRAGKRPDWLIVERGEGEGWEERERYWIAFFREKGTRLTNATDGGEGAPGWVPDQVFRDKIAAISRSRAGWKASPEGVENNRRAQLRRAARERELGIVRTRQVSEETRQRLSLAARGKKHTPESRLRMSESRKNPSAETRAKLSAALHARDPEKQRAFGKFWVGKKKSPETRQRMSEAAKARWAKHREEMELGQA